MDVGPDLVGHDRDHVSRQLEIHRTLEPVGRVEEVVDVAESRGGVDDFEAGGTELFEYVELRAPLPNPVVEQRVAAPLGEPGRSRDHDDRALLGVGPGDRVGDAQAPHAVGDADRAHPVHAGIGVGREARGVLAGAVDEFERGMLEHAVEGKHVVARQAEHMPQPVVGQPPDQVLPDRHAGHALWPLQGRPHHGRGHQTVVEARAEDDRHRVTSYFESRRCRTASIVIQNPRKAPTQASTTTARSGLLLNRQAPIAWKMPHASTPSTTQRMIRDRSVVWESGMWRL
jgi:hypothetical protein